MHKNILLTGLPRSGKTTLLKKIISNYPNKVGFITAEVSKDKVRTGFRIETHNNKRAFLASTRLKTDIKVSKYFVDIQALDSMVDEVKDFTEKDFLYLDEIGQMELFSDKFKQLALKYLDSKNICIATISAACKDDFIEQIKKRKDVVIVELTGNKKDNKEELVESLIRDIIMKR